MAQLYLHFALQIIDFLQACLLSAEGRSILFRRAAFGPADEAVRWARPLICFVVQGWIYVKETNMCGAWFSRNLGSVSTGEGTERLGLQTPLSRFAWRKPAFNGLV